jgi:hypothetical protein
MNPPDKQHWKHEDETGVPNIILFDTLNSRRVGKHKSKRVILAGKKKRCEKNHSIQSS